MENKNNTNKNFKIDANQTDKTYQGSANQAHGQSDGSLKPGQVQPKQNMAPKTGATGGQENQSNSTYQQPSSADDKHSQNRPGSPFLHNNQTILVSRTTVTTTLALPLTKPRIIRHQILASKNPAL
ncbi:MAG: hypothetical protein IPP67_04415 [Rhodospirillaceae bacterium]|nr:hypothetical protein [Rhodospirillaceae bacterium]